MARRLAWGLLALLPALGTACGGGVTSNLPTLGAPTTPAPLPGATAVPASPPGKLTLFLVPSASNPRSLAPVNTAQEDPALAHVPFIFDVPKDDYGYLRRYLWTESSLIFSGSGFAGTWTEGHEGQMVVQLNGLEDPDVLHCVAVGVGGVESGRSCGNAFSRYEFQTSGYTAVMAVPAPLRVDPADLLEVSIVLGTSHGPGKRRAPILLYGGNTPLTTSFLDIGPTTGQ